MDAYAKSKTPETERDKRQTPWDVYRRIEEYLGLGFCHDVCAEPHTAKVPGSYWTKEDDALNIDWASRIRICDYRYQTAVWMNPPYSDPMPWVEKAYEQSLKGLIVVGLVPDDRSTQWYQEWVEMASMIYVPDRRIAFCDGDNKKQHGNPKGSVIPVWTPLPTDKPNYIRFSL